MMANDAHVAADLDAPPITRILADFVAAHPSRGWDDSVDREAHRSLLNWVGCAIGASRHPTVEAALAAVAELEPGAQAMILGRSERVDVASAALLNGITSHTFDFDDTHLKTVIHPAGPVASAALALAERHRATGRSADDVPGRSGRGAQRRQRRGHRGGRKHRATSGHGAHPAAGLTRRSERR